MMNIPDGPEIGAGRVRLRSFDSDPHAPDKAPGPRAHPRDYATYYIALEGVHS